jgi:TonB family protein
MADQFTQSKDDKKRSQALVVTLMFHAILFLLFFLIIIRTPIPPFPEGGSPGIEINFGTSSIGMGDVEANDVGNLQTDKNTNRNYSESETSIANNTDVVTSDVEESIGIPDKKKDKPDKNSKAVEKKEEKKEEKKPSNELTDALNKFKSKSHQSGGDGNSGNAGNQGDPNGSSYTGGGGSGIGRGPGSSYQYSLKGRKIIKEPRIFDDSQEEGIVVIAIVVDAAGNVIQADAQLKGSTTTSSVLQSKARQAAKTSLFNKATDDDAPLQYGTMTFKFKLEGK